MEKIISWLWRSSPNVAPQEDSYWFDSSNSQFIVVRANGKPEQSLERRPASEAMAEFNFSKACHGRLAKHSQAAYDFLKARGF